MINNFSKFKNILITGGAGFIGGAVIRRFLLSTSSKIFNLDKLSYASDLSGIDSILKETKNHETKRYMFLKVDLFNIDKTREAINFIKPDLILHLAAETHVDRSIERPHDFINSNIVGTFNLLSCVRELLDNYPDEKRKTFRFHHISTDEVFGSLGEKGYFSEKSNYEPRSPYSASKAASDHLVSAWQNTYDLPALITNCSNNYGPWQFPEKLIPLVIYKVLNKKKIPMYGDGMQRRDWLYVEDHVDALLSVVLNGRVGQKYCIGGGEERSNKDVILKICFIMDEILKSKNNSADLIESVKDRPGHDLRYSIDSSLIQNELGWSPKNNFENGLRKTIKWYLSNLDWCKKVMEKSNYKAERLGVNK